mgnify:CR=1 FL=1
MTGPACPSVTLDLPRFVSLAPRFAPATRYSGRAASVCEEHGSKNKDLEPRKENELDYDRGRGGGRYAVFSATKLIALSAIAVIVSDGFTPGLALIALPSIT